MTRGMAGLVAGLGDEWDDEAGPRGPDIVTIVDLIEAGQVDLVINVPRGRGARADGYEIRRAAVRRGVPTMTNAAAANAAVQAMAAARSSREIDVVCLQDLHRRLAVSAAGPGRSSVEVQTLGSREEHDAGEQRRAAERALPARVRRALAWDGDLERAPRRLLVAHC